MRVKVIDIMITLICLGVGALLLSDKRFDVIETRLIQDTKETIEKQNGYLNLYNPRSAFWQGKDLSERDFGNCFFE